MQLYRQLMLRRQSTRGNPKAVSDQPCITCSPSSRLDRTPGEGFRLIEEAAGNLKFLSKCCKKSPALLTTLYRREISNYGDARRPLSGKRKHAWTCSRSPRASLRSRSGNAARSAPGDSSCVVAKSGFFSVTLLSSHLDLSCSPQCRRVAHCHKSPPECTSPHQHRRCGSNR